MLRRLLERQQEQFIHQGGIREQMHRARTDYRNRQNSSDSSDGHDKSKKSG